MIKPRHELMVGGIGGQGVITIGYAIAGAAVDEYKYVTRFPIYMATQRGGAAIVTVILADDEIASPILSAAMNGVAMEEISYNRFSKEMKPGGTLLANVSMIKKIHEPKDYTLFQIPATDMAQAMGDPQMANMLMLGAYRQLSGVLSDQALLKYLEKDSGEARFEKTKRAYDQGAAYAKEQGWAK